MNEAHDLLSARHEGVEATFSSLKQVAYLSEMCKDVTDQIKECSKCCRPQTANTIHTDKKKHPKWHFPYLPSFEENVVSNSPHDSFWLQNHNNLSQDFGTWSRLKNCS